MTRHILGRIFLLLWVFLAPVFVPVQPAETGADPPDQSTIPQVDSPAQPEKTPGHLSLQMVGQVGGRTEDVAVQGDYAYVAVGLRLVVLDVSEPITPTEIGSTMPFPQFVEGVAVSGTLACVADGTAGLRIVDVSDPSTPVEVGAYDTPGYSEGVAVASQYAYVADGHYGLRVVDVSDPAHPAETGYAYPLNYVFDMVVEGNTAYLAAAGAGLLMADVSDPAHPVELGSLDTPGYAYGVDVLGDTAYVADGWEGLRVVDVSNPAYPAEVGSYSTPGWAFDVAVVGSTAYVADAFGGLRVLDVSDPGQPVELGGYEVPGAHAGRVAAVGDVVYLADRDLGLQVIDASDPSAPAQIGAYSPLVYADAVRVSGDYAYVGAAYSGLRIVDVSDPAYPVEVGAYGTHGHATSVAVEGKYAYVAVMPGGEGQGMHVVDVSDPTRPGLVGYVLNYTGAYRDVVVSGGIAYVADEWGLEVISVTDPYSPTLVGYIELMEPPSLAVGVDVAGDLAHVAEDWFGLKFVDVSDPSNLSVVGVHDTPGYAEKVAVAANFAYVADGDGLQVVDVSDPAHPVGLGSYDTPGWAVGVAISGTVAYVTDGGGGLFAVDVSNPFTPTLISAYDTPGYSQEVAVVGDYVYVADGHGGLLILKWDDSHGAPLGQSPWLHLDQDHGGDHIEPQAIGWRVPRVSSTSCCAGRAGFRPSPVPATSAPMPSMPSVTSAPVELTQTVLQSRSAVTCTVVSPADSGAGTLRWCLENALSGDIITFDPAVFPPASPVTIVLESELPHLSQGHLTIDGSDAGVILDGSGLSDGASGLVITSDGNVIKGLQILHFPENGVVISEGAKYNLIGGDRSAGSGPMGEGNLVSGNGSNGILIEGTATTSNTIVGNYIGTDLSGMTAMGNANGVTISGASRNRVGGTTPGTRNLISGNDGSGISIGGQEAVSNTVIGNFIGTDATGGAALGNHEHGIVIGYYAAHNRIGGTTLGERNVISGNGETGIDLMDVGTASNIVVGNYVGTDASGTVDLGNKSVGIAIGLGASGNTVAWNVASGNGECGIQSADWGCDYNTIIGNLVGTDATGTIALGNDWAGVCIGMWAAFNRVGGTAPDERNVIAGNGWAGVSLYSMGRVGNLVIGNYVGMDAGGTQDLGNVGGGVQLDNSTRHAFVGGTTEDERNLISGNGGPGVAVQSAGVEHNFIAGNYIGTNAGGTAALSNDEVGIATRDHAGQNVFQGNLISGNGWDGVSIADDSTSNYLRANRIGVAVDGVSPLPNNGAGVMIEAPSNTVGGPYSEDGNVIAFNDDDGIQVWTYSGNTIRRNSIYSNTGSGISLADGGNNSLPAPLITAIFSTSVSGTACPGCIVEVFSDEEDEGRVYEGYAVADGNGNWTWTGSANGPYVTATATDEAGNTSPFSAPLMVWRKWIYLPVILREGWGQRARVVYSGGALRVCQGLCRDLLYKNPARREHLRTGCQVLLEEAAPVGVSYCSVERDGQSSHC